MIRRPPRSTPLYSSAASDVYKRQTQADGRLDTIPLAVDQWILYWNKDLFAKKNLQVPTTLDEMVAAAKELNDPANRVAGFVARGLKNANTMVWTAFMQGWDVEPIDSKNVMHTNGPEAIAAAQIYQTLLSKYAPAGVNGFNWME